MVIHAATPDPWDKPLLSEKRLLLLLAAVQFTHIMDFMIMIMTAFSVAAALGVPFGLKLAQWWKWEAPFLVVATVAAVVWAGLLRIVPPVRGHLTGDKVTSGKDFLELLRNGNAWTGLALMVAMIFGHFTIIPFLSPYLVGNVGLPETSLFLVYLTGGLVTIFTGPLIGKLADRHGRFRVYVFLIAGACVVIRLLTSGGPLRLLNFDRLGLLAISASLVSLWIFRQVKSVE